MGDPQSRAEGNPIQVKAVGICGTDLHIYDWEENIVREYKPKLPLVMGHEFAGIAVEVGPQVENFKAGDRVTGMPVLYCGECYFCRDGRQNICDHRPLLGLGADGAFAQYVSLRSANVYRLDDRISFELGALSEITCVGLHALEKARLTSGETVAVVGPGPLGVMMAALAKHSGAGRIFITGLEADRERLEIARQIGATPIQAEKEDPRKSIWDYTAGLGADVVFETAGSLLGCHPVAEPCAQRGESRHLGPRPRVDGNSNRDALFPGNRTDRNSSLYS